MLEDARGEAMPDPVIREFLLTFWKVHILHHAASGGVYGQWMLDELRRHGHRLSPGTMYPLLARMATRGWLRSATPKGPREARVYRITPAGRQLLDRLRESMNELQREVGRPASIAKATRSKATHNARTSSRERPTTGLKR